MSAYREAASIVQYERPRSAGELWALRNAYEKRWRNGCDCISLLCAGLIPSSLTPVPWVLLTAWPVVFASWFILRGLAERWAKLPPDIITRGVRLTLQRERFERRHDFIDRLILRELYIERKVEREALDRWRGHCNGGRY